MKSGKVINDNYFDYLREVGLKRDSLEKNMITNSGDLKYKKNNKLFRFTKSVSQEQLQTHLEERIKTEDDSSKINYKPSLFSKIPITREEKNEVKII